MQRAISYRYLGNRKTFAACEEIVSNWKNSGLFKWTDKTKIAWNVSDAQWARIYSQWK